MRNKFVTVLIPFLVAGAFVAHADTVRGPVVFNQALPSPGSSDLKFNLKTGDIAAIAAPTQTEFVDGVEVEIAIPDAVRRYPGSFALYVFSDPTPAPALQLMTISATRVMLVPVPSGVRFFVVVPLIADSGLHSDVSTTVANRTVPATDFPLVFTIQPVSKGLPDSVTESSFEIHVRPVASRQGGLQLQITDAQSQKVIGWGATDSQIAVTLNGAPLDYRSGTYALDPGIYTLGVTSSTYSDENRTFSIDRGQVNHVSVVLKLVPSTILLEAPQGTVALLDGSPASVGSRFSVQPGDHNLVFRVGDFSVSKRFTVDPKKDYDISLFLDIVVKEAK